MSQAGETDPQRSGAVLPSRPLPALGALLAILDDLGQLWRDPMSPDEREALARALDAPHAALRARQIPGPEGWQSFGMKLGYMTYREALPFASNSTRILEPDPLQRRPLERATALLLAAWRFYTAARSGALPADTERGQPLEMALYRRLFAATRRPAPGRDEQVHRDEADGPPTVIVAHRGRLFALPLLAEGEAAPRPGALLGALQACVASEEQAAPVQLGTALPRERWARLYARLRRDPQNRATFDALERALFVLALDLDVNPQGLDALIAAARDQGQVDRYFDKSTQILVFGNGEAALNYEHSFVDGANTNRFCQDIFTWSNQIPTPVARAGPAPRLLRWALEDEDRAELARAQAFCEESQAAILPFMRTLCLPAFGQGAFARHGVGDDAAVQLALQLSSLRCFGAVLPVNEALHMRHFDHGRYDTILTVTPASRAFVEALDAQPRAPELRRLLDAAVASLRDRVRAAKQGQGGVLALTTLLGLRAEAERLGQADDGFSLTGFWAGHPALERGLRAVLISSNPGATPGVAMAAYPDVGDSIDLPYLIRPDGLRLHIKMQGKYGPSLDAFAAAVEAALGDLLDLAGRG